MINVMATIKMSADEKRWRAESDAETMARYQEIMQDTNRRNAAIKAARTKAAELSKRAQVMQYAAGGKLKKK